MAAVIPYPTRIFGLFPNNCVSGNFIVNSNGISLTSSCLFGVCWVVFIPYQLINSYFIKLTFFEQKEKERDAPVKMALALAYRNWNGVLVKTYVVYDDKAVSVFEKIYHIFANIRNWFVLCRVFTRVLQELHCLFS